MSLPVDLNSFHREVSLDTLEKQLICPICLEVFTKPVVILPCQHNLCRKCANELYQPSLFQVGIGGRFRCPSCRHEVVLDRHGVYGLQRNLLVENIIDVYKQTCESSRSSPKPLAQITCEEHEGEKLNIYCITCQVPTCSLCKVFGAHSTCHVAPLPEVCQQQKDELSEGIGALVATNKHIQGCINNLEEICKNIEENGQNQKEILCEKFDHMCGILEERRKFMMQQITYEQDEKTGWTRSLVHTYSEQVDSNSKLVQTGLNAMEEPEMAAFLQTSKDLIEKVSEASKCTQMETIVPGYENMDHYKFDFDAQERALYQLDFINTEEEVEDIPDPEPEPESEPDSELESDPESMPEPEPEAEPEPMLSLIPENSGQDHEPNSESWGIKRAVSEAREDFQPQDGTRAETKKDVVCEKTGWNTQQGMSTLRREGHDAGEETKLYPSWYRPHSRQMLYSDQARPTDTLDVINHASLLVREPSVQHPFQLQQTLLSVQMSGSFISMATENHKCLGSGSLDSAQGHGSEIEKNISDLEERSANRDRVTSITPQGEPCSLGTQDNREMEQSIDTPFHNNSDRETETGRQTVSQAAATERSVVGPSTSPVPSESVRLSFSFSWLNPLTKKK